jgi:hypothetical protein
MFLTKKINILLKLLNIAQNVKTAFMYNVLPKNQ